MATTRVFKVFNGTKLLVQSTLPPANTATKDQLYQISLSYVRIYPKYKIRTTLDGEQIYPLT